MSTHDKQSPVILEDLLADGELTLAELARIIGGADPFAASTTTPLINPLLPDPFAPLPQTTAAQLDTGTVFVPFKPAPPTTDFGVVNQDFASGDTPFKVPTTDSSYTSHIGATGAGASGNEGSVGAPKSVVMNLTMNYL